MENKIKKIIVLLTVVLMVVGCSAPTDGDKVGEERESILAFVISNLGDNGPADLVANGTKSVAEKFNMDYKIVESGVDSSTYVTTLLDAIESGDYDYVITPSWWVQDALLEKANTDFKDITFIIMDTNPDLDLSDYENVIGVSYKQNEGSFLAGVYASLMSSDNKVGAILSSDDPILNDFGAGYIHGVKWYNDNHDDEVEYKLAYLGDFSINDDYETAKVLYSSGADIIYNVAGPLTLGAAKAAEEVGGVEKGKHVIGVDSDQWVEYKNAEGQDVTGFDNLSTSMLKKQKEAIEWVFEGLMNNEIDRKNYKVGIEDELVGLAKNENYMKNTPEDIREEIDKVEKLLKNKEIEPKSYFDFDTYEEYMEYRDNPNKR